MGTSRVGDVVDGVLDSLQQAAATRNSVSLRSACVGFDGSIDTLHSPLVGPAGMRTGRRSIMMGGVLLRVQRVHRLLANTLVVLRLDGRCNVVGVPTGLVADRLALVWLESVTDLVAQSGSTGVMPDRMIALVVGEVVAGLVLPWDVRRGAVDTESDGL